MNICPPWTSTPKITVVYICLPYLPTNRHLTQGRASFRGCWRGIRTPNDCKVEYFAPLRKLKTATPTVKYRNYLNCEALKCTKTTFPVAAPRTPSGRAYSTPPDPAGGEGAFCPYPRTPHRPCSQPIQPQTSAFRASFYSTAWLDPTD